MSRRIAGVGAVLVSGMLVSPVVASSEEVHAALAAQTKPLTVAESGIGDAGGAMLLAEARQASFLCIGESHLNVETPRFTSALLPELADAGYELFGIETGPTIASHMNDVFASGDDEDIASLARLFAEVPFSAAFVDHVEEFNLMQAAVKHDFTLAGLDQVFMGGARFNLTELVKLAPNDAAYDRADDARAAAQEGFATFIQTRDQSSGFLLRTTAAEYDELRAPFNGVPEALRIIDELELSGRIYRLYGAGQNYESNRTRIDLMKRHLAESIRGLDDDAKVLLKFGSVHMGRGYSPLNQQDLGNAASELGVLRGGGSLHVLVTAAGSRAPDGSFNDFTKASEANAAFVAAADRAGIDGTWAVIDLRPVRAQIHDGRLSSVPEALEDLVWRYDVVVLVPEFTRATTLPGVPNLRGN